MEKGAEHLAERLRWSHKRIFVGKVKSCDWHVGDRIRKKSAVSGCQFHVAGAL